MTLLSTNYKELNLLLHHENLLTDAAGIMMSPIRKETADWNTDIIREIYLQQIAMNTDTHLTICHTLLGCPGYNNFRHRYSIPKKIASPVRNDPDIHDRMRDCFIWERHTIIKFWLSWSYVSTKPSSFIIFLLYGLWRSLTALLFLHF